MRSHSRITARRMKSARVDKVNPGVVGGLGQNERGVTSAGRERHRRLSRTGTSAGLIQSRSTRGRQTQTIVLQPQIQLLLAQRRSGRPTAVMDGTAAVKHGRGAERCMYTTGPPRD